uniref:Uncharacterized protein n=1 Tax=Anguilla anguilla TaxID=7936 RepID=A0A0E9ULN2_ANGAN
MLVKRWINIRMMLLTGSVPNRTLHLAWDRLLQGDDLS